jgi:hypothetical protein
VSVITAAYQIVSFYFVGNEKCLSWGTYADTRPKWLQKPVSTVIQYKVAAIFYGSSVRHGVLLLPPPERKTGLEEVRKLT